MRRLFIILLFLIASVWFGLTVLRHPGFLYIVSPPWNIQMPLWVAFVAMAAFLMIFYLIITCLDRLSFAWFRLKNWLRVHREHKSYSKTQHGLSLLIESRWRKAEKLLLAGVNQSIEPLMNYLGAAKAAHEQAAFDRRDDYIKKAYQVAPNAALAIGLTQADLEFSQNQIERALATLTRLKQISPYHPRTLKLLEKCYVRLGDWEALNNLIPALRKAKLLRGDHFEQHLYCAMLSLPQLNTLADIEKLWKTLPRAMQKNPEVVCAYVKRLRYFSNTTSLIETLIRKVLKTDWQPELASIYVKLPLTDVNQQLVIANAWLKIHGQKPELLFLLGTLCTRMQLWGKAKDYFQKCLAQGANSEASLAYGRLLASLNEEEAAAKVYQAGLTLST